MEPSLVMWPIKITHAHARTCMHTHTYAYTHAHAHAHTPPSAQILPQLPARSRNLYCCVEAAPTHQPGHERNMRVCARVCVCVRVCKCVCVCICVCARAQGFANRLDSARVCLCMHARVGSHSRRCATTYAPTDTKMSIGTLAIIFAKHSPLKQKN